MGVYIKGMEMPKQGRVTLQIGADGVVYVVDKYEIIAEKYEKNFEVFEIPPHGKLIDADAVERNLVKMQMAQKGVVGHGIRKSRAVVRDMETIIPAEESNMDSFIHIFEEDNEEDGMDSFIRILKD